MANSALKTAKGRPKHRFPFGKLDGYGASNPSKPVEPIYFLFQTNPSKVDTPGEGTPVGFEAKPKGSPPCSA